MSFIFLCCCARLGDLLLSGTFLKVISVLGKSLKSLDTSYDGVLGMESIFPKESNLIFGVLGRSVSVNCVGEILLSLEFSTLEVWSTARV